MTCGAKGPISPSSERNPYTMGIIDAFTHYVELNPVPNCIAFRVTQWFTNTGLLNLDYQKSLSQTIALNHNIMSPL